MYVRTDTRKRAGDRTVGYVSIAHNVRETVTMADGSKKSRSKPVIVSRLGKLEDLDETAVRGMADALSRFYKKRFGGELFDREQVAEVARELAPREAALRVLTSREYGLPRLVEKVWADLGLRAALQRIGRERKIAFDFERVVFAMVLNRLLDPQSKRACNTWVKEDVIIEGIEPDEVGLQHFYRALDLLEEHEQAVLSVAGEAARSAVPADELVMLRMDTTTSYTESDFDDIERKQIEEEWRAFDEGTGPQPSEPRPQVINDPPLRMRGHSKDKRPREPQIKVGLLTTTDRRLVHVVTVAGNESDQKQTQKLVEAARRALPGVALCTVMDSGMGSAANLAAIDALGPDVHRISGVPLRNSKYAEELLSRPGRWAAHPYKEGFKVRSVLVPEKGSSRAEQWVATRNAREARRTVRRIDAQVAEAKAALEKLATATAADERSAACALLAKSHLKRFVQRTSSGGYGLDRRRIARERRLAGVKLTRSTLASEPVEATLRGYDAQYGIEDEFRTYKGPLKLRPMHHRASRRLRAHVVMCSLALMVLRELERRTERSFAEVLRTLRGVRATQMQQGHTTFWQREEWTEEALAMLTACGVGPGPRTWGAARIEEDKA